MGLISFDVETHFCVRHAGLVRCSYFIYLIRIGSAVLVQSIFIIDTQNFYPACSLQINTFRFGDPIAGYHPFPLCAYLINYATALTHTRRLSRGSRRSTLA